MSESIAWTSGVILGGIAGYLWAIIYIGQFLPPDVREFIRNHNRDCVERTHDRRPCKRFTGA